MPNSDIDAADYASLTAGVIVWDVSLSQEEGKIWTDRMNKTREVDPTTEASFSQSPLQVCGSKSSEVGSGGDSALNLVYERQPQGDS